MASLAIGTKVADLLVYLSQDGDFSCTLELTEEDGSAADLTGKTFNLTIDGTDYAADVDTNLVSWHIPWSGDLDQLEGLRFEATLTMVDSGTPTVWAKGEAVFQ